MGRRKKKSIRQEYTEGLRHLAFGEIQDAVRLLYAPEEQILPAPVSYTHLTLPTSGMV